MDHHNMGAPLGANIHRWVNYIYEPRYKEQ